jgi:hypothetical protein
LVDKLIGINILHFLDRVFQEFASDLSRFTDDEDPLRAVAPSLRGRQRGMVLMALGNLRYGLKSTITLPPGLALGTRGGGGLTSRDKQVKSRTEEGNEGGAGKGTRLKNVLPLPEGEGYPTRKAFP